MSRRKITSMPVGLVIAALLVIGLVALAAVFLTGSTANGGQPAYETVAPQYPEPARTPD